MMTAAVAVQLAEPDPRVTRVIGDLGDGRPLGSRRNWAAPPAILVLNKVRTMASALADWLVTSTSSGRACCAVAEHGEEFVCIVYT